MPLFEVLVTRDTDLTESATIRVRAKSKQEAWDQAYEIAVGNEPDINGNVDGVEWSPNDSGYRSESPYLGSGIDDDVTEVDKSQVMVSLSITEVITSRMVADWVTTAYEGGIIYWCRDQEYVDKELAHELDNDSHSSCPVYARHEYWERGGSCRLWDAETSEQFDKELSMDSIVEAFVKLPSYRIRNLLDDYDAEDADVLIQTALFGEVVYG